MSGEELREHQGYNRTNPRAPFYRDTNKAGARSFNQGDLEDLKRRRSGPDAADLAELDSARDVARILRTDLIYGYPTNCESYDESDVPTSRNLPMFLEFLYTELTGQKYPGDHTN